MISILLPCYNSAELLQKVFSRSQISIPMEIILYDNGGNGFRDDERNTSHWLANDQDTLKHKLTILGDGKNIGLNAALNKCAAAATFDWFYLPHSDMCLMKGWDVAMFHQARSHAPGTFLFCSRSIEPVKGHTDFHLIRNYGDTPDDFVRMAPNLRNDFASYKDSGVVTGYRMPFFLDRKLWDKMGGVDENYFSYATDDDLFMTAYDVGVRKFWMIRQSVVYHMQGKSNVQQTVDRDSQKPYEYFHKKWADKGYDTSQSIDATVQNLVPWNLKVQ